jgi:hypothetical protein
MQGAGNACAIIGLVGIPYDHCHPLLRLAGTWIGQVGYRFASSQSVHDKRVKLGNIRSFG